ncbi:hypothetical protein [Streptomyces milbemycinicus]|uniref:Uncharacterized protein n=1 Tax=Streptomyces milbemycinicus TaxID=476552 RepID=A0ABW8LNS7_9ACTN
MAAQLPQARRRRAGEGVAAEEAELLGDEPHHADGPSPAAGRGGEETDRTGQIGTVAGQPNWPGW